MKILGTEEHRRPTTREKNNYGNRQNQNRDNNNSNFRQQREKPQRREGNWNNRTAPRNDHPRNNTPNKFKIITHSGETADR